MDMLISWIEAIPLKSKDTKLVGRLILDHIICQFGCPEETISDNGDEFCSKVIDEICSELSIRRIKTAPYHAQANGKLEKLPQTADQAPLRKKYPNMMHGIGIK